MTSVFATIPEAIDTIREGRMVILVDDEDRENEGDLVIAAEKISPEAVNFMAMHARGLICLPMSSQELDRLNLPMMTKQNLSKYETAFTVSIEAKHGVTTGISAHDRAHTIQVAINPNTTATDVITPGHIFPLRAKEGGVLVRAGQTEGSVDLARLAGLRPGAVICEIMKEDGTMARLPDLQIFAEKHQLKIVSIKDLIAYRMQTECLVEEIASSKLPVEPWGDFTVKVFTSQVDRIEHVALIRGPIDPDKPILVRVHSACLTGDVFGSARCDCGPQLQAALARIAEEGGVLLYMHQEGRGIGLANKIKAYALQDGGLDTVEANQQLGFSADHRDYGIGTQILKALGIKKMRLMTNNPRKIYGIDGYNLEIVSREPIQITPTMHNLHYLQTKQQKLGHWLDLSMNKENVHETE